MDSDTRSAAIDVIVEYAHLGGDSNLLAFVGFGAARHDVTEDEEFAVIVAVLPLLTDERLEQIMRHIAEVLVDAKRAAQNGNA